MCLDLQQTSEEFAQLSVERSHYDSAYSQDTLIATLQSAHL
jgi:hypothetical protein